jgi:hypothetical protein
MSAMTRNDGDSGDHLFDPRSSAISGKLLRLPISISCLGRSALFIFERHFLKPTTSAPLRSYTLHV